MSPVEFVDLEPAESLDINFWSDCTLDEYLENSGMNSALCKSE